MIALLLFLCKFIAKKSFFHTLIKIIIRCRKNFFPMLSPLILEIKSNFPTNIKKDIDALLSPFSYNPIWQTIE